jgi:hypothetical protein
MHIQNSNNFRTLNKLPQKPASKGPDNNEPPVDLPKEGFSLADAAVKVVMEGVTAGAIYYGGGGMGGGYAGTALFGASIYGGMGAYDGGKLFHKASKDIEGMNGVGRFAATTAGVVAGGAVGAGMGALRGVAAYALGTAMGGGVGGAALGGAAVALGSVAYAALRNRPV